MTSRRVLLAAAISLLGLTVIGAGLRGYVWKVGGLNHYFFTPDILKKPATRLQPRPAGDVQRRAIFDVWRSGHGSLGIWDEWYPVG